MTLLPLILALFLGIADQAFAACPIESLCVTWDEPSGVTGLTGVMLLVSKDGVDQAPVFVASTNAMGGGSVIYQLPTVVCQKATYRVRGFAVYTNDVHGLSVEGIPLEGVLKDRTQEPSCLPPPIPPAVGLKIVSQTKDSITIECTKADCPNGLVTSTTGSTATKQVRTVKKK